MAELPLVSARMPLLLPKGVNRVLVTGGAGFIGGALVRRLLTGSSATVFNLDKLGYASDLASIEQIPSPAGLRHQLLQVALYTYLQVLHVPLDLVTSLLQR
jgi:dTDP-glucose 4,6-dehydratase